MVKGVKHHMAKLNEQKVRTMRKSTKTHTFWSQRYGVSIATIAAARTGRTWTHVR